MAEYFTQKCAVCGKEIVTHGAKNWGYKIKEPKGPYRFFCTYKCQRQYEKKHQEKKVDLIAQAAAEEARKPSKQPQDRGVAAQKLAAEIKAGGDPIKWLRNEGYKNPHEAYQAVRHYVATKMPELAEVLKPIKELRKAEVLTVEQVPDIEQLEEQVAEMLNAEEEAPEKPEETMTNPHPQEVLFTMDYMLRTVDEAALKCSGDGQFGIWSNEDLSKVMFREAWKNAEKNGVMKMRKTIRQKLGVEE